MNYDGTTMLPYRTPTERRPHLKALPNPLHPWNAERRFRTAAAVLAAAPLPRQNPAPTARDPLTQGAGVPKELVPVNDAWNKSAGQKRHTRSSASHSPSQAGRKALRR